MVAREPVWLVTTVCTHNISLSTSPTSDYASAVGNVSSSTSFMLPEFGKTWKYQSCTTYTGGKCFYVKSFPNLQFEIKPKPKVCNDLSFDYDIKERLRNV